MIQNSGSGGAHGRRWLGRAAIGLLPVLMGALGTMVASAEPTFTFVDLQPKANQRLADDLHGSAGNNLANVPQGEQKLGDATFKIGEKLIHIRGAHAQDAPEKVEIPVSAAFDQLHILHATGYGQGPENAVTDGTEVGAYVVHYADNSEERIAIRYGEELRDWWEDPEHPDISKGTIAWTGTNTAADQMMRKVRLYAMVWTNPHADKTVTAIDFQSNGTECDPFLVAMTLEKK